MHRSNANTVLTVQEQSSHMRDDIVSNSKQVAIVADQVHGSINMQWTQENHTDQKQLTLSDGLSHTDTRRFNSTSSLPPCKPFRKPV